ncbi:hypothetical protein RFI_17470 [Reticulomyxa filosa]|uniref:Uncharacterized protein n=1 Tax=Reticulomyxa filosa TaxID=46433 RepID=X6N1Y6_RETFI|nr:hypothetical protein RFI_17470 [Reticulomyxa filosa]|eukprot:ETO19759.1 hypothetical protein RFI_17470 [Reticulomyxa filosa]
MPGMLCKKKKKGIEQTKSARHAMYMRVCFLQKSVRLQRSLTTRPLRVPRLPEHACADSRLYRKDNLHGLYSADKAQTHVTKESVVSNDDVQHATKRNKHLRIETILEEQQMETNNAQSKCQEMHDLKKSLETMEFKVDGLQIHLTSVKSAMKTELKDLSKALSQHKKNWQVSKKRPLHAFFFIYFLKPTKKQTPHYCIHICVYVKFEKEANRAGDEKNSALGILKTEMKTLEDKNRHIWEKLEEMSLRMTILSQRNSDSMVLLKSVQQMVKQGSKFALPNVGERKASEKNLLSPSEQKHEVEASNSFNQSCVEPHPVEDTATTTRTSPIHTYKTSHWSKLSLTGDSARESSKSSTNDSTKRKSFTEKLVT